jgi:hypothetical protein
VVLGPTDNGQNGHWTNWPLDQVVIGLTSNGQSSNWTKWSLDQLKIGPTGDGPNVFGPSGNKPAVIWGINTKSKYKHETFNLG